MRIKKDGHLVEPLDLDVDSKSQKTPKKKQMGSEQSSRKCPRSESDPKDTNEGNFPSAMETSRKGKEKVTESSHRPDVDTDVDIPAEERRTLKIGMMASRLEMDPPLSTPRGQTSEHHGRANQRLASLEEDLAHAKLEEEKLKAMIQALEKEKREMNARVALMERKDLYDLLKAKMEGFQIANHLGTIGGFKNLNLTIAKKWVEIPTLNLEEFEKCPADFSDFVQGHRTLQDEVDRTGIDVCYQSLLHALKTAVGTLPNSLVVFEYMRSIFDSYVNPSNDPNLQPLVKGLDADDFSVDKFFGLQDPTSPDDVQASPDFEEDLRTNERLRLQAEIHLLHHHPNIVPVPALVDLTQYASSLENEVLEDQGWPRKEDLTKADLEFAMYKGCYLREDVINMYINEAFLKKPREELHNMFYMNNFWFTKASELLARYDKTNHAEEAMIKLTRLRKSICPEFHDEDMQGNLPAWIFMPIHGKKHWSLAIIRIHNDVAMLGHLDSFRGIHDPKAIFHILKTLLCLIVPIDPDLVMTSIMNVEQQEDGHSCGKHVLEMLAGAARKESDRLDRCFREEGLTYIATLDQVRSFDVLFPMYYVANCQAHPCNYNLK
ncbi:hypothetical protein R1flu_005528 [Riccia fluitans]|uniref:Ubiquitin-like protease family profile domain-containing protein n=1 Tax=Riccia fluitans TaxID=41844 RepID=A0ABD1YUD7_9MARC